MSQTDTSDQNQDGAEPRGDAEPSGGYDVGYGRPPEHARFKKGHALHVTVRKRRRETKGGIGAGPIWSDLEQTSLAGCRGQGYMIEAPWPHPVRAMSVRVGESSNGRTADSDSACLGSNPSSPANKINDLAELIRLAHTER